MKYIKSKIQKGRYVFSDHEIKLSFFGRGM